ncbi:acetyltransferase (GNAT) family protein [Bacillus oleivorans]|uniref:Acetyltransferase (GNAT) family protein n=1 Tax=Bacillus oleivorans TaxID=1448271 RepID=A0A285CHH0_9BACI|nr:GNAT family N-acetyltransferase [Bacillus oleivorans]SNX66949.1 acetyltransferase (GNAT) family protein [Bacillus oleivorans]
MTIEKDGVKLTFYQEEFKQNLEYDLPEDQANFTGLPLEALEKCKIEDDRHPVVILYQNKPSGFFVLHGWEGVKLYSDNKDAILVRAYSINPEYQGKGIAKASLALLPSFVKENFPDKNEIILGVNFNNKHAQQVYLKTGFIDKGHRIMGTKGEQFVYHLPL